MHFAPDGSVLPAVKARVAWLMPLLFVVFATTGGWVIARELRMPPLPSASAPIASVAGTDLRPLIAALASPQAITVTFPDQMVVTTPSPVPLPTSAALTAPVGMEVCTDHTPKGVVCKMPKVPLPPPTEVPDCPVRPGASCVATGKPVTHLPTPIPALPGSVQ